MRNLENRALIRPFEIQEIYGISRSTAYRLMGKGKLPSLNSLSSRCKGWLKSDLDDYFGITNRKAINDDNE
jgi:predicted DNA-binding transcriptional regulator AlpA